MRIMKKAIYISIIVAISITWAQNLLAQKQDSLLRRQMELEREFNPTLRGDANKIQSLPSLPQPTIRRANTAYATWTGRTTPPLEIALPQASTIKTEIPFQSRRGYISLAAGNYANVNGIMGLRLLHTNNNDLSITLRHHSTNGDIRYVQEQETRKNRAKVMDNKATINYSHTFDALQLGANVSYENALFNYYGNSFGGTRKFEDKEQMVQVMHAGMYALSDASESIRYGGQIHFKHFATRYGDTPDSEPIKGSHANAVVDFTMPFYDGLYGVGVEGGFLGVFYNSQFPDFIERGFTDYKEAKVSPYLQIKEETLDAKLGVKALFQYTDKTKMRFVPNASLQWHVAPRATLYATASGGFDDNTFLNVFNETRYIHPMQAIKPSFTSADIKAGVKIGAIDGLRFDLWGGFRNTKDEHFWIMRHDNIETLSPLYGNLNHTHVGALLQSTLIPTLNITLRAQKNFYKVTHATYNEVEIADAKAYNKPTFEADAQVLWQLIDPLKVSLDYHLLADRYTYFNNENVAMQSIHALDMGAIYQISSKFSIHLQASNILNQQYDIWYGYPAQGFHILGGFTFVF